jgi:nucleotide-binding universal stress UspA family protein
MSFTTLMIYIDADDFPVQRVRLAASLTDKFSAKLIGFSALAVSPPVGAETNVIVEVLNAEIGQIKTRLSKKEDWFRKIANEQNLENHKISWRFAVDYPIDALAREARSADLLIVGRSKPPGSVYNSLNLGGFTLKAGRPVLIVPEGFASLSAKHVVVGWKDTREARRAVQDSLPFLHQAERTTIVEICGSGEEERARERLQDVAIYLGRHKIKAEARVILHDKGSDAARLIRIAQDEGSDLLVTGAYGHSRLGEWIFGGMTRELLTSSSICCLVSH